MRPQILTYRMAAGGVSRPHKGRRIGHTVGYLVVEFAHGGGLLALDGDHPVEHVGQEPQLHQQKRPATKAGRSQPGRVVAASAKPAANPAIIPAVDIPLGETPRTASACARVFEILRSRDAIGRLSGVYCWASHDHFPIPIRNIPATSTTMPRTLTKRIGSEKATRAIRAPQMNVDA